jgi:hydrogenase nickel incorporation protein HypA/HybF
MHELSLTRSIVAIVSESAGARRVTRVRLEVGALAAVVPEALLFCFDVASRGTVLEGATLEIITVPGRALCRECGSETALLGLLGRCACGSRLLERLSGEELNIKDMEVEAA